jgi:hypothetical protein
LFCSKSGAGPVTWPDPAALWLPERDLQTLLPPDPLHPLVVDHPARRAAQKSYHLPVSQPAMLPDQGHKVVRQLLLVFPALRDLALCRPVLAKRRTGLAVRNRQSLPDVRDARPAPWGAQ